MSRRRLRWLALWLAAGAGPGCVLCPWLAEHGEQGECAGNHIDDLDGKSFRLERLGDGASQVRSLTLRIDRDDCSIHPPQDLAPLGVAALRIENPRSVRDASLVLELTQSGPAGRPLTCSAPLDELEPMQLTCPPEAGKLRYVLEPVN